ncbi:hypothetical protein TorRG33x02_305780, partial [Trema orientale]
FQDNQRLETNRANNLLNYPCSVFMFFFQYHLMISFD